MTIDIKLKSGSSYHFEGVTEIEKEDIIIWFVWFQHKTGDGLIVDTKAFESFWIDDIEKFIVKE